MKICVVIPVHNEASKIGAVVSALKKKELDVVVIDDGSQDQSGSIAARLGAIVVSHGSKKGKGLSLCDGFQYAVKNNYEGIVTMDGDGQHAVSDIDNMIETAIKHH